MNGTFESYLPMFMSVASSDCGSWAVSAMDGWTLGVLGKAFVVTYVSFEVVMGGLSVCSCDGDSAWSDVAVGMSDRSEFDPVDCVFTFYDLVFSVEGTGCESPVVPCVYVVFAD